MSVSLFLLCKYHVYHFLDSTFKWYYMIFISLWFISLSIIISSTVLLFFCYCYLKLIWASFYVNQEEKLQSLGVFNIFLK